MRSQQVLDGRYRLDDRLGAGGMSVVWRAQDLVLQRQVAIKVLATKHAVSVAARQRIRAEARAAARLWHPNVTGVFDYGETVDDDGTKVPYVVMELLPGRTLAQRLEDGPLPSRVALRILSEVAAALAAAHAQDLVHRDVKPSNVMLTPSGAKVVDFGIAAVVGRDELEADGLLLGTPAYLAPERLTLGQVSPASDIYALGLLIYRALTNRLPWQADTTTQMLDAHVYVEPEPLPPLDDIPAEVNAICDRCLAKEPADRPGAAEVAAVLATAAGIVPPPQDDDPALVGLVAAMDASTQAAAAAPVAADVVDAGRPKADPELTTEVVKAAPVRTGDRRRRALLGAAGALLVAGAVIAALVVPSDEPGGVAGATGTVTPTATVAPTTTGTQPTSTAPAPSATAVGNDGTVRGGQATGGSAPESTRGAGTGTGTGTGTGSGSGSGSGGDDPDDNGGGAPPPPANPGPTPGRSVDLRPLPGVKVTARCVGDQAEVLGVSLLGYEADYPSGPQDTVTITLNPVLNLLDPVLKVRIACRGGSPVKV
ncbi:serine/threonine-protein kinase [Asanoa ferruginea]|uniref:non-specific serine/threonine protein kinase n=1 Tax=Asanoa ferruginea TaxID=53367 RepID=A0A3D9ZNK5_9ACTN|nr:serine/threonine-protein kinase [Asanoa ferruginea]REF98204.1 serine/threonine-protein kinase [Asanoa ferruginea]